MFFLRLTRHPVFGNLIARSNSDRKVAIISVALGATAAVGVLAIIGRFDAPFWVLWLAMTTFFGIALFPVVERYDHGLIYERGMVCRQLFKRTSLAYKEITTYYYEAENLTPDPPPRGSTYRLKLLGQGEEIMLPCRGDLTPKMLLEIIAKITELRMPVYDELFEHGEELSFGPIRLSKKIISFPSMLNMGRSEFPFYHVEAYDVRGATMTFRMRGTLIMVSVDLKSIPNFMCFLKLLKQWVLTVRQS